MEDRKILYLEADEEIPSVIDRIKDEKSINLTLVVPKASIVLQSVINLKLILRSAKQKKKVISIVSQDAIGRNLAAQVGIPAYDSINAKTPVLDPRPEQPEENEIFEVDLRQEEKVKEPDVKVHHFQDNNGSEEEETGRPIEELPAALVEPEQIAEETYLDTLENQDLGGLMAEKDSSILPEELTVLTSKPQRKPHGRRWGLLVAAISALIVAGLGLVLFYPKAVVVLSVKGEEFNESVEIIASKKQQGADLAKGIITAEALEVIKDKQEKIQATGVKNLGSKAKGNLGFYNGWSTESQNLTAGTRLSKDGKSFITTADITIPGATLALKEGQVVTNPGKATGNVEATDAGDSYNVGAGRFVISDLSGDRGAKIYAETDKALSGGSTKEITVISRTDIEQGKERIREVLEEEAKKELTDQAKGKVLLEKAIQTETLEARPSQNEGAEAKEFTLTVKARAFVLIFDEPTFRDAFLAKIREKVPATKELVLNETDEITTAVSDINAEDGNMTIDASVKTKIGTKIDQDEAKLELAGQTIDEAKKIAEEINGVESSQIDVKPNWLLGRLPFSKRQINLKIQYQ